MRRLVGLTAIVAVAMLGSQIGQAAGDHDRDRNRSFKASLTGFEEPPAVSTTGRGEFEMRIDRNDDAIHYKLSYEDLEGDVTQAHVHVGQLSVNGGISFFLCAVPATATAPLCPGPREGTVRGTITVAQIIGPAGQFFTPGEMTLFDEVVRAIRAGVTYANVHSSRNPGGEIRGQIRERDHDWWDHD